MEALNLHEWTPCQVYGHLFEDDEHNPGWRTCQEPGCEETYEE